MTIEVDEALRYLGAAGCAELRPAMAEMAQELMASVKPRWVWRMFPLVKDEAICLSGAGVTLPGTTAARMLSTCSQAALLACTLGSAFDGMLRRLQARDMVRAVMLDACASAYVEAGCDAAEAEMTARLPGMYLTDRFSPGYGDLPLSVQAEMCAALDVSRRLGVTLTDSFLMNPQKTVTAVIGLSDRPQMARIRGCEYCKINKTCALRKGGKRCGL